MSEHRQTNKSFIVVLAGWLVSGIGSHTCYLHLFGNVMHINKVIVVTRKMVAATFLRRKIELRPDFSILGGMAMANGHPHALLAFSSSI